LSLPAKKNPAGDVGSQEKPPVLAVAGRQRESGLQTKNRVDGPEAALEFDDLIHIIVILKVNSFFMSTIFLAEKNHSGAISTAFSQAFCCSPGSFSLLKGRV